LFAIIIISAFYFYVIINLIIGFDKVPVFTSKKKEETNTFSIIIPFRNEAKNIPCLANSLAQLNYSKNQYEVIFVDDDSTDNSVNMLQDYFSKNSNWRLIKNNRTSKSPKKDA
jgi:cellulose synthase/poly-beta-1,6-N-acetylglucosamine synthase-like glycosyltransferase